MLILVQIFTWGMWAFAGFWWGRLYELHYGMYKNAYKEQRKMTDEALKGWKDTNEYLKTVSAKLSTLVVPTPIKWN